MDQTGGSETRVPMLGFAALALVGAAILALLVMQWWDDRREGGIVIVDPQVETIIVVSVEGAVATPGAYDLPGIARVRDAIEAAGGPRQDADLLQVNLARRLRDEERLVIPSNLDHDRASVANEIPATPISGNEVIDLNHASPEQLEALPGIGPVLADRIVAYRQEHGPFRVVDDLAEIDGISERMVEELRPLVTVGP